MGSNRVYSSRPKRTRSSHRVQSRPTSRPSSLPHNTLSFLRQMRTQLETVRAIVHVSSSALKVQHADADPDVALVLQRGVGDALDRQIEALDVVVTGDAP
jgi:hypothetical protein